MIHKEKVINACDKLLSYIHALEFTLLTDRQEEAEILLKKDMDELRKRFGESMEKYRSFDCAQEEYAQDRDDDDAYEFGSPMFGYE